MSAPAETCPRRRPPARKPRAALPVTIRWGVPALALGALAWFALDAWRSSFARVQVVDRSGQPIADALLELFAWDESGDAPSPTTKLGEQSLHAGEPLALGASDLPDNALLRVSAPGYGVGIGTVRPGETVAVELGEPRSMTGTVLFAGKEPATGARVDVFAGGARGVKLGESIVGADGRFTFAGFSSTLADLHLRVFHPGHTVVDHLWVVHGDRDVDLRLQPTLPVEGRLLLPEGVRSDDLRLRIYNLPGVEAPVAADGRFMIDHLPPPPFQLRVLLAGLPAEWTHPLTLVETGQRDVEIRVQRARSVAGRVIDAQGRSIANAAIVHEHGPHGRQVAHCNVNGFFCIERVPSGRIELRAEAASARRLRQGIYFVQVDGDTDITGITVSIE